ncbi:MAG: hypothetical protein HYT72_02965 [Candidatus Aenigmarchaeota archaeon]|nr:hypothetical protein [Candidatus Aenigmarchaeota archaeon]
MLLVWGNGINLDGLEYKAAVVFRGKVSYRGILQYNPDGVPCLFGCAITGSNIEEPMLYPLQEGDALALPE